jgi:hypothetical protein
MTDSEIIKAVEAVIAKLNACVRGKVVLTDREMDEAQAVLDQHLPTLPPVIV